MKRKFTEELFIQAEGGDAEAQYLLAGCYDQGSGIDQNAQKATFWFSKSAEQGNSSAQFMLGTFYQCGRGVEKNLEKAIELYTKAAKQHNLNAYYKLKELHCDEILKDIPTSISLEDRRAPRKRMEKEN